ncbi:3173_t:CDS:2, partial [Racocetra persica]
KSFAPKQWSYRSNGNTYQPPIRSASGRFSIDDYEVFQIWIIFTKLKGCTYVGVSTIRLHYKNASECLSENKKVSYAPKQWYYGISTNYQPPIRSASGNFSVDDYE